MTLQDVLRRAVPRPESFTSRVRGPALSTRVGLALAVTFGLCFATGVWSHLQYEPPAWAPIGPTPASLYRLTQGIHVASGLASIPLLLIKLWSVYPHLFRRPPRSPRLRLLTDLAERGSIAVLVASAIFLLVSGTLNVLQWYPWDFSFRATHEAVAWLGIGALVMHIAVKLPSIRSALSQGIDQDRRRGDPHDTGPARRTVLRVGLAASFGIALTTAGQSVPALRRLTPPWLRDGSGPQGLAVNRTAREAGIDPESVGSAYSLLLIHGATTMRLTAADLASLPQHTVELPIACVEGWSQQATWTGVRVRDLMALVQAPRGADLQVRSLQTRRAFGSSVLPHDFVADPRTLLALQLNGEPLSLDHGSPCRLIAPNRPGVLQTKWVNQLEVL